MNNGQYHTEEYKAKQQEVQDRRWGVLKTHTKECQRCGEDYTIEAREKTRKFKESKYCSRSCANNRQEWWNENATNYRTIAFRKWDKKCIVCGFDKIVTVHHMDEDHSNNDINNLVPLCPNHHEMFHSKYRDEVEPLILEKINGAVAQ